MLRQLGFKLGGGLLVSKRFKWVLLLLRKVGIVRMIHALLDVLESFNKTKEMECFSKMMIEKNNEIKNVYNMLEDEESKKVYKNILNYRKTKKRKYIRNIITKKQYFISGLIPVGSKEIFVDGGAFTGDTIIDFNKFVDGVYDKIFAFEPDEKNIKILNSEIEKRHMKNVEIFPYGLWSSKKDLFISNDGGMIATVSETGDIKVDVNSIDNLLSKEKVTFIKMDIEGSEMEALKGAEYVIRTYKPILAISIYHKPADFYEIPTFIKSLNKDYKLYVRHHTCFSSDTVVYAIPA